MPGADDPQVPVFADRRAAGRALASRLIARAGEHPLIAALPRGGVPIGFEVARALAAPLHILAVRKLGAPGNPELAVGAIAEGGSAVVDRRAARRVGMTQDMLDATVDAETRELRRRVGRYREGREPAAVRGRMVIVVDDGLATGLTALAAVRALRGAGARRVVVAVPVGTRESVAFVGGEADEVIALTTPDPLGAVGFWYSDFAPVSDEEVEALLAAAASASAPTTASTA